MTKRVLGLYWSWACLLVALYLAVPAIGLPLMAAIVLTSAAAVVVGVRRNRPRRSLPWLLLAGGILAFGTGSITAVVLSQVLHLTAFPSLADAIFLGACFPMLLAALVTLTRSGAATRDRANMIDALILTAGAGFLSWTFLITPYLNNPALTGLEKTISVAYPLCDVLLLAILARIAIGGDRSVSLVLLLVSGSSLLAADALYGLSQLNGDWQVGGPVDIGWLMFYLFGGASALHPSMVGLTEPKVLRGARSTTHRTVAGVAVLGTASLVAPGVLVIEALRGPVYHGVVIAAASALLILLTAARVAVVATTLRRSVARERELRLACEALLSAASRAAVEDVVHTAIRQLLPGGTSHRVVLTTLEPPPGGPSANEPDTAAAETGVAMRYRSQLPTQVATQFTGFELALHCPLSMAGQRIGDLYVAADETALVSLQDSVPILAGQAASMIQAITLNQEISRRGVEEELLRRAYLDPLTGLGNRPAFQDAVAHAVDEAARIGGSAGVLVLDVDDFKVVNDSMGHGIGDQLLIKIGQRLVTAVEPAHATVARLAGDEFGIVILTPPSAAAPELSGASAIEELLEHLLDAFNDPFTISESVVSAQLSIGAATTDTADDDHQLLGQADVALGAARSAGKGRWRLYEASLHAQVLERRQLRIDLDQALADEAFQLYYQPIVDLRTGATRGLEALIRWLHPTRGMVPPLQFIDIAEESGLIVPLGAWVLRTSIAAAAQWHRRYPVNPPYVSVNVSVRQFRARDFVNHVLGELAAAGLPPHLLNLEITESLLLGDDEQISADLAALRLAGVKVSIDDFGTGYSSLSYLHRVAVDTLKLDKSFVDTIATSHRQLSLVRGIIQLADTLSFDVVAEGIETAPDRDLLIEAQCGLGQGYLFARPMPHADADAYLQRDSNLQRPLVVR